MLRESKHGEAGSWFRRLLLIGLGLICALEIWYLLRHSTWFALQSIEVRGERYLSEDRVVELSGLSQGMLVFDIRFDQIRDRMLESEPILDDVRILQLAPNRLQIRVQECEPVFWLKSGSRVLAMAEDGVFLPLSEDFQPPRIEIELSESELKERRLDLERLSRLKLWLGQLEHSVLADFSRLLIPLQGAIELQWSDVTILLKSLESFHQHIDKIQPFLKKMKREGSSVQYIDLRFDNMVVKII